MSADNGTGPSWADAVRKWERRIGAPIEQIVTSDSFYDAVTQAKRLQAQIGKHVEAATEDWYRMFNIPTGSEIRRLRKQLGRMERTLERMANALADAEAERDALRRPPHKTGE